MLVQPGTLHPRDGPRAGDTWCPRAMGRRASGKGNLERVRRAMRCTKGVGRWKRKGYLHWGTTESDTGGRWVETEAREWQEEGWTPRPAVQCRHLGLNLCESPRASSSQGSWGPLCHPHSEPSRATTPASAPAVATDRPVPAPWAPTWPDKGSVALRPPEGSSRACTGSHPAALPLGAYVGTRPRGDTAFLGLLGPRGYQRGL